MAVALGKSNYGGGGKKTYFKLKDGDNVYRILPPMFDLAEKGVWTKYYAVEYGYYNTQGKMRPFLACRVVNKKTKMVEVESPSYLYRQQLKAAYDASIELEQDLKMPLKKQKL